MVDTNVAVVANGRPDPSNGGRPPTVACRAAAVTFLRQTLESRRVLVDLAGNIQAEYRKRLNSSGEPGIGDRFYYQVLMSIPSRVERVELPCSAENEYDDFPDDPELAAFDPSDRKFAALARRTGAPVANATDSDWLDHHEALERNGVTLHFVCGADRTTWLRPG